MTDLASHLARRLGLTQVDVNAVAEAALLHDIGLYHIAPPYLHVPRPLTFDERIDMWRHPVVGEQEMAKRGASRHAQLLVRWHHEWWIGTGYPDRLSFEDIPIGSRILRAVDLYSSLIADRPYRSAFPEEEAREAVRAAAGIECDPYVTKALLALLDEVAPLAPSEPRVTPFQAPASETSPRQPEPGGIVTGHYAQPKSSETSSKNEQADFGINEAETPGTDEIAGRLEVDRESAIHFEAASHARLSADSAAEISNSLESQSSQPQLADTLDGQVSEQIAQPGESALVTERFEESAPEVERAASEARDASSSHELHSAGVTQAGAYASSEAERPEKSREPDGREPDGYDTQPLEPGEREGYVPEDLETTPGSNLDGASGSEVQQELSDEKDARPAIDSDLLSDNSEFTPRQNPAPTEFRALPRGLEPATSNRVPQHLSQSPLSTGPQASLGADLSDRRLERASTASSISEQKWDAWVSSPYNTKSLLGFQASVLRQIEFRSVAIPICGWAHLVWYLKVWGKQIFSNDPRAWAATASRAVIEPGSPVGDELITPLIADAYVPTSRLSNPALRNWFGEADANFMDNLRQKIESMESRQVRDQLLIFGIRTGDYAQSFREESLQLRRPLTSVLRQFAASAHSSTPGHPYNRYSHMPVEEFIRAVRSDLLYLNLPAGHAEIAGSFGRSRWRECWVAGSAPSALDDVSKLMTAAQSKQGYLAMVDRMLTAASHLKIWAIECRNVGLASAEEISELIEGHRTVRATYSKDLTEVAGGLKNFVIVAHSR